MSSVSLQGENTQEVNREFLAWLAGFWEGEGSAIIEKRRVRVRIAQVDRAPLDLIQKTLGVGKIREDDRSGRNPKWKKVYTLDIGRKIESLEVLRLIFPFLKFRQKKIVEAINFLEKRLFVECSRCGSKFERRSASHKYCVDCGEAIRQKRRKEYFQRPEVKERMRKNTEEYRKKKKMRATVSSLPSSEVHQAPTCGAWPRRTR